MLLELTNVSKSYVLPQCTVLENVLIPTLTMPATPANRQRAEQLLARVGLSDQLTHRPGQLPSRLSGWLLYSDGPKGISTA